MPAERRESADAPAAVNVFVGRDQELDAIRDAFGQSERGHLRIVLLLGDSGIGKTRLAAEAAQMVVESGAKVLWGRCHEDPGAPPYWPWIQIVRSYAGHLEDDALRADLGTGFSDIARLVPSLLGRFPDEQPAPAIADPDYARLRLFDSFVDFVRSASRHSPLALVFDNIHLADRPSLLLLTFLAQNLGEARVLLLATYRPDALNRSHPLSSALADLTREAAPIRLRLQGLGTDAIARFVEFSTGIQSPPGLTRAIHAHTEGNPLFIGEVVRWLHARGDIRRLASAGGYVDLGLPDGVREVIGKRLLGLPPACLAVLEMASAIGRQFEIPLLETLENDSERELAASIEEALHARLVEEVRPGRYQFTHALIRETLYDEISPLRRRKMHGQIARGLVAAQGDGATSNDAAIAHHFGLAAQAGSSEDVESAITYLVRAGQGAVRLLAYEEGVRSFERALDLLGLKRGESSDDRLRLLLDLGDARARSGNAADSMSAFVEAFRVARELGSESSVATAALGFEQASWWVGMHGAKAAELLESALATLGMTGGKGIQARLKSALARSLVYSGDFDRAREVAADALALARQTSDSATICAAQLPLLTVRWGPERFQERNASARECVSLARAASDPNLELESLFWLVYDLIEMGPVEELEQTIAEASHLATVLRTTYYVYSALLVRTSKAIWEGRFSEAERLTRESLALGSRMRGHDAFGIYGMQMFALRREQGRLNEIERAIDQVRHAIPNSAVWRPGLAVIYAELGMRHEAGIEFESFAKNDFADLKPDAVWATCLTYMADACHFLRDSTRAETLLRLLEPFRSHNIVTGANVACLGPADRYLGLLAWTAGRRNEAEGHFRSAIAMSERMRAPVWLVHARFDFGRMLAESGGRDVEATGLLQAARRDASGIGMQGVSRAVDELLGPAAASPVRKPVGERLSRRELEVLQLVVVGRSNREIAERLTISTNTVANHVKNILAKTGAVNRTEAASYAIRSGLVERT